MHESSNRHSLHNSDPDYTRPLLEIPETARERLRYRLQRLYGKEKAGQTLPELIRLLQVYYAHKPTTLINSEKSSHRWIFIPENPRKRFPANPSA